MKKVQKVGLLMVLAGFALLIAGGLMTCVMVMV